MKAIKNTELNLLFDINRPDFYESFVDMDMNG